VPRGRSFVGEYCQVDYINQFRIFQLFIDTIGLIENIINNNKTLTKPNQNANIGGVQFDHQNKGGQNHA
jgi:hypothetical protein